MVDIATLRMQNTYLWAADRYDFASTPALVLQKALDIVPKVVEAYEQRGYGSRRHVNYARNLTDFASPLGKVC